MLDQILRLFITVLAAVGGLMITDRIMPLLTAVISEEFLRIGVFGVTMTTILSFIIGGLVGGILGFLVAPLFIKHLWRFTYWVEVKLNKMPVYDIIAGALGLAIGLIISNLLGSAFLPIPIVGKYVPLILSIILGYLGINVAIRKREELISMFSSLPNLPWLNKDNKDGKDGKDHGKEQQQGGVSQPKILDTSVIIDGRIADICKSGFIEGTLIIPIFVLEELQHIADSSDLLKRNRGRRGLDILNRMQKELELSIQIDTLDFEDIAEVDSKLIKLGQTLKAKIITNDYNLNKVSELQGVPVLNINELSNAVKPVVLPGEEMTVHVVKDGKEFGQGVAYLDDGTMIVVDGGKKHIGETVGVLVTSVLQTAAGRMIFAKPKVMA
ncbi:MAG TPA: PIN/TRAM domain-containing protein [Methylomusa anaerophila]|uniref:Putative PIN and TRAM-domain containing protein n=1 Tax=Methylomusa anaerophila TaxID=1930071 RepID=A0A348AJS6_9FIRM|nr:PIN/TRAM domain-containing protein [Methylomusa anaerophila]BBB91324.1 putative PIN and TRAM-domain containing protein precursor [Methylomusa anaerophila]HML90501.1 PIN/TRAM domain-containing protein [Methylomusa anaerophila]